MSTRYCRLEFVRTGIPNARTWYWRFFAANGEETGRSSEDVRNRVDAIRSAEITTGCYAIRDLEDEGVCWRDRRGVPELVNVRWLR